MGVIPNAEVLCALRGRTFHYSRIEAVLMSLALEAGHVAYIVGDPENAAYEFAILDGDQVVECSNVGYGYTLAALRDALIAHCGMPQPT